MKKKTQRSCLVSIVIVFEALDFLWDLNTAAEYYRGKIFDEPQESVFADLLVFTIVGYIISLLFMMYFVLAPEEGDGGEGVNGTLLRLQSLIVVLEAFPQSIIAKFCFDQCPLKDDRALPVVPMFYVFSALSSIIFFVFLLWFCFNHNGWTPITKVCMTIGYVFALKSLIFTLLALFEYYNSCTLIEI